MLNKLGAFDSSDLILGLRMLPYNAHLGSSKKHVAKKISDIRNFIVNNTALLLIKY